MKKMKMTMLVALTMLTATGARAGSGVLDFSGFTITYHGDGQWAEGSKTDEYGGTMANTSYDLLLNIVPTTVPGGVRYASGNANFGVSVAPVLQSYGGNGTEAIHSSFSYTVQAKPGWQLSQVMAYQQQQGTWLQFNGGKASASGAGTVFADGGYFATKDSFLSKKQTVSFDGLASGTWRSSYFVDAFANGRVIKEVYRYDADGNQIGYSELVSVEDTYQPLTAMSGSFSQSLSAATTAAMQNAYVAGGPGDFYISAAAMQNIAPVPEPDTYGMMAAGFALFGVLARSRQRAASGGAR
jgi:hypothetical protein